jgi:hypothetical protein
MVNRGVIGSGPCTRRPLCLPGGDQDAQPWRLGFADELGFPTVAFARRPWMIVTPNELARTLGVTGLQFRNWLRAKKASGHPTVVGHVKHQRYEFTPAEASKLLAEYRAEHRGRPSGSAPRMRTPVGRPTAPKGAGSSLDARASKDTGHRVTRDWRGRSVTTLEDLLRPGLLAVVVGINPAPASVATGHYYQGRAGRRLWACPARSSISARTSPSFASSGPRGPSDQLHVHHAGSAADVEPTVRAFGRVLGGLLGCGNVAVRTAQSARHGNRR